MFLFKTPPVLLKVGRNVKFDTWWEWSDKPPYALCLVELLLIVKINIECGDGFRVVKCTLACEPLLEMVYHRIGGRG